MTPPDGSQQSVARSDFPPLTAAVPQRAAVGLESFSYDDEVVRKFMTATFVWGIVGMLVGLLVALQLAVPTLSLAPYLTFGRLRPLHTNAVDLRVRRQRDLRRRSTTRRSGCCKARMFSDALEQVPLLGLAGDHRRRGDHAAARLHAGQGIRRARVADRHRDRGRLGRLRGQLLLDARASAASGTSTSRSGSTSRRSSPSRSCTSSTTSRSRSSSFKSYSIYAGVQDALMQWWYGHNAVAFFLTTPFLGIMYYFLPKAAERPVYSATGCRSSTSGRWSSSTSGPARTTCTTRRCPTGRRRSGMIFSVMLWMPSLGRHDQRPAHAARRVEQGRATIRSSSSSSSAITFYGMATFEGPLLSIKSVNALCALHRLDHRPRARRRARLERLHGVRHDLLARCRASSRRKLYSQEARRRCTSGSGRSASCSTSSRCRSPASRRA